ncbi:hypothetical protein D3C72_1655600 [compost metagenome]
MIERQAREGLADVRFTECHADQVFREYRCQQLLEQQAGRRRGFAELEHDPIAGGQGPGQRPHGQKQRVVPGHDDADHAQRLIHHLGAGGLECQAHFTWRRFHPLLEVPFAMAHTLNARHQFCQPGFIGAATAEVFVDGCDQGLLLCDQ